MKKQPNILFLMSDEHRPDVAGFAGNDIIRTPTLDWLAQDGFVFDNAYTPSPVCVPGRQCMMSGQLPKTNGCEGWVDLPPGHMTFARRFSEYAYNTLCFGKLHHFGADAMQGWTQRPYGDTATSHHAIGQANAEALARYNQPLGDVKWSDTKEVLRAGIGPSPYQLRDWRATQVACDNIDEIFTSAMYDRPQSHRPVLMKLSLLQPHYPYFTSEEKFTYYLNRVKPYVNEQQQDHPVLGRRKVRVGVDASEREIRRATAAYYGMIETIDDYYAIVLDKLRHVGENLDDWIIVYTTDHGEMLGQHGVWEKQNFHEASVRVPLVIRWPQGLGKSGGRRISQNVNLCDLFATLCDMADIPTPDGLDSRSMVPLMKGQGENWRNETISQNGHDFVMIKQDHLKYLHYGQDNPPVLFDLQKDPGETTNFHSDPAYADHVSRFEKRLATLGHGPHADAGYVNAGY